MPDEISVRDAAEILQVSGQTVRNYIRAGALTARRPGARSYLVTRASVERLMRERPLAGRRRGQRAGAASAASAEELARERDDLRARVIDLQEIVVRLREAGDLHGRADAERATEIDHLTEALRAAERVGELRRQAAAELEEALGGLAMPGHLGQLDKLADR
jgi:excisionase family DNA binding protein